MYVSAIVLAAGKGLRLNSGVAKPLVKINFQPIIIYCLKIISKHPSIKDIVVVVNAKTQNKIIKAIKRYRISKIIRVVRGGRRRQDSVYQGLLAIDERTDLVLIHDGVRPFITKGIITSVIKKAKDTGAAIVGVPVKATIKKGSGAFLTEAKTKVMVVETIDRENLWEIQTPQVFKKDIILKAYEKSGNADVTDDAMLVEKLGVKVSVVPGSYHNIKITTPEDIILAKVILKMQKSKFKNQINFYKFP
jgi:2-C-methyl-D-erythritol 4-phosphate cytidylyltransferase